MRLTAALTGSLREQMRAELQAGERAVTGAIRAAVDGLKGDYRQQVQGAGLGARLARTWRGAVYPRSGASLSAAGVVFTRAPHLMRAFGEGATIRSKEGFFLAIPTESAPRRGEGGKRISPATFPEARYGTLRFVYRRGKPSLLVVDGVRINRSGRVGRRAKGGATTKTGRFKKGIATVVMFVLVPQVRLKKRLDLDGASDRWAARLPQMIVDAWGREVSAQQR